MTCCFRNDLPTLLRVCEFRAAGVQDWRWQDHKKARQHAPPSLGRPGVVKGLAAAPQVDSHFHHIRPCIEPEIV